MTWPDSIYSVTQSKPREKILLVTVYIFLALFVQANNFNDLVNLNQSQFLACTAECTLLATHTVLTFII